jgi:cytochrome c biogenesis protein CcmG, thiol:disulfide interchange protein DsbE
MRMILAGERMRQVLRRGGSIALVLLGVVWTLLSRPATALTTAGEGTVPQVGFMAPAFTLTDLDGQNVNLSDHLGKVVVLNFWASWCPPCRAEMPAIQQVYQDFQDQGLVVLAVNVANQDTMTAMLTFLGSFEHTFPILLDENGAVNRLYAVSSLPTTFFIDREGMIRDLVVGGPLTTAGLSARVESLLQEVP